MIARTFLWIFTKKIIVNVIILFIISIIIYPLSIKATFIKLYKVSNYYAKDSTNNLYFITREFSEYDQEKVLAINIQTFDTLILSKDSIQQVKINKNLQINKIFLTEPIKHSKDKNAIYLTIDLCPCNKSGFEKAFFEALINYSKTHNKVINIGIAITAKWGINHPKELKMLKYWNNNKDIIITWINHGYVHFYDKKLPNNCNFMLHDINNYYDEIINNEIYMLENSLIPSVFFRFPGLIYNKELLSKIREFNLISIDCDAWLAKTKGIFNSGSIILLHGNKNEPIGINLFLNLLKKGKFDNYEFKSINNLLLSEYNIN